MRRARSDRILIGIVGALLVVGIVTFLSASFGLLIKDDTRFYSALVSQIGLGLGGGGVMLYVFLHVPLRVLRRYALVIFSVCIILTLLVFAPGIGLSLHGARRWLDLGITTIQPAELLKIGYVTYLASYISQTKNRARDLWGGVLPFLAITATVGGLLLVQPDTDSFLVIASAGCAIMFAAGMRAKDFLIMILGGVILLTALIAVRPYLWDRVETFLNPARDPQGSGYQIQQSLIAIGSGELVGRGYGQSLQKFSYLPEAQSDSIFAVYAEEFGFVGSLLLMLLYLSFALRGMWVAARVPDLFSGLVALGLVVTIVAQSFLNIAAMSGIAPVGGLPLPFMSHGGTALLVTLAMVGIILQSSRTARNAV